MISVFSNVLGFQRHVFFFEHASRVRRILITFLCVAGVIFPGNALSRLLTFNTEEWYPYTYIEEDNVTGTTVKIVKLMAKKANVRYAIITGPWSRAYSTAIDKADNCVFPIQITEERRPLFKWVETLEINQWTVYKLKGNPTVAKTLDDLKEKVIGGYTGDAVATYMKDLGFKVDEAPSDRINPKRLLLGKIDVWATTQLSGIRLAHEANVPIEPVINIRKNSLALACNLSVSDEIISDLQEALDQLNTSGKADEIRDSKFKDFQNFIAPP